jgi:hypothetical protein
MANDPGWDGLLVDVRRQILQYGYWAGEVRVLRDAIGAKRMGPRVEQRIRERLAEAGYEIEGDSQAEDSIAYESFNASIAPAGTRELAEVVQGLLPEIRFWDKNTGDPPWRDLLIARRSVSRFLERKREGAESTP